MSAVVAAARCWIGTPYVHRASVRGVGADCLGLLRGVWRDVLACEPEDVPQYSADWNDMCRDEPLWTACLRHMLVKGVDTDSAGDVVLFRMRDAASAKHLGIQARVGAQASFIHAYSGHGVLETSLSAPWRRRIVARFAIPLTETGDL